MTKTPGGLKLASTAHTTLGKNRLLARSTNDDPHLLGKSVNQTDIGASLSRIISMPSRKLAQVLNGCSKRA